MIKFFSYLIGSVAAMVFLSLYLFLGLTSSLLSWFFWFLAVIGLGRRHKNALKRLSEAEEEEYYADNSSVGLSLEQEMRLGSMLEKARKELESFNLPSWRMSLYRMSRDCVLSLP